MKTTIDMAREAGLYLARENPPYYGTSINSLKAFEALVRADQREIDAKECKFDRTSADIEIAIRNRGNT
jgi:hypothetical protein